MFNSLLIAILAGYLLGSVPFAHLIATRVGGVRLAAVGSGNVGTRNLSRQLGLGWGLLGGTLDSAKGLAAMALGYALAGDSSPLWFLAGTAAVAGHNWPLWLRFRGGQGLATSLGTTAWVALWPELICVFALGWLVQRMVRNITITAILSFLAMYTAVYLTQRPVEVRWFLLSLAAVVALATFPRLLEKSAAKRANRQ